jgi:glycyl-tRNA synthetase beta chain
MPAFFLEILSEEIPARMQARAAEDLSRLLGEALAALKPRAVKIFYGPRRIAYAAEIDSELAATSLIERGPRIGAPEQALTGFLRKHHAERKDLREENGFYVLEKATPAASAASLIESSLPGLLRRFPWPKSMRWGGTSNFTWVRPLRRITCLLDGIAVPFSLALDENDDGHGLIGGNITEGHRFHAPGEITVQNATDWETKLHRAYVIADPAKRRARIAAGLAAAATAAEVSLVPDDGLLDEVNGLVEWPVVLTGKIDAAFMDLPPEVMQVSMRINQRYFATRTLDGKAAPYFIFAANIEAPDQGAAIIAGNERVLRARFSDARHFWDLDRKTKLADRVPALDQVTFHAALGSQGARAHRIAALSRLIAKLLGADPDAADRAGLLAKADLLSGMVGEFPELQGVMGGYYARHDGEGDLVANAIRDHYQPRGLGDIVPADLVSAAVALADKLDQLTGFFAIGEKPSGSGDPYALRRAALGTIRIIRENALRLPLRQVIESALKTLSAQISNIDIAAVTTEVLDFIAERLRVQLRGEGARHDILSAVFAAGGDDDIVRLLARSAALNALIATDDGRNLLAAYKRAANILRIEDKKDGPHAALVDANLLQTPDETTLHAALAATANLKKLLAAEDFAGAMAVMAGLRAPLDAFFANVTVNADDPGLRRNRLGLLASIRERMNDIADFSAIEG